MEMQAEQMKMMASGAADMMNGMHGMGGYNGMGMHGGYGMMERNTKAICCMPGMDCWDFSYESGAGRASIEAELEDLRAQY